MYIDQFPETDLARPLSKRYGIPIARTIREAILGPGLVLNGLSSRFLFAARLAGCAEPVACEFWLQEPTFGH